MFIAISQNSDNTYKVEQLDKHIEAKNTDIFEVEQGTDYKLFISDMESTIIDNEFFDEIALQMGLGDKVADITARAMRGELDFTQSMHSRIELIKGVSKQQLLDIYHAKVKFNSGAHELLKNLKQRGVYTVLVSGGFTLFSQLVADELGFDKHYANILQFDSADKLIGVQEPVLDRQSKLKIMRQTCAELGIGLNQAIACGDGANDLDMLSNCGLPIAYKAKPNVKKVISNQLNYTDLSCINLLLK